MVDLKSPQVLAALIAAMVSLLGVLASFFSSRWELRTALKKLDLDFESLRQTQLKDILAKRMEAYPKLWSVMLTYDLNWQIEGKVMDQEWAKQFLIKLNECNAEYGVFFSQSVYSKFYQFRSALIDIERKLSNDENIVRADIEALATIAVGDSSNPGLGTLLKDDLGSYMPTVFQLSRGPATVR